MKTKLFILFVFSCLCIQATQAQTPSSLYEETDSYNPKDSVGFVALTQGKIIKIADHYMIQPTDNDNARFYPKNLDDAYKNEGMLINFSAVRLRIPPNVRMMGTPIFLQSISANSPGKTSPKRPARQVRALPSTPKRSTTSNSTPNSGRAPVKDAKVINQKGKIIEAAGYYVIETSEGIRYFDSKLADKFKVPGLSVVFTATLGEVLPNVRMVGRPIEIEQIRVNKKVTRPTTQDPDWIKKWRN